LIGDAKHIWRYIVPVTGIIDKMDRAAGGDRNPFRRYDDLLINLKKAVP